MPNLHETNNQFLKISVFLQIATSILLFNNFFKEDYLVKRCFDNESKCNCNSEGNFNMNN